MSEYTVMYTDGTNIMIGNDQEMSFVRELIKAHERKDGRTVATNIVIGAEETGRIFYDQHTICGDGAWVLVEMDIPTETLLMIVGQERTSIWKPRTVAEKLHALIDELFD